VAGARLVVVGVRHHSPACARLVAAVIRRERPAFVLIEGPADMNERIGELLLGHRLPIAIFTYHEDEGHHHASYTPFCRHSPEWLALTTAVEVGARPLFMDLPAWTPPFRSVRNRYADPATGGGYEAALCRRLGFDDTDRLWDHLFEADLDPAELEPRLRAFFAGLRPSPAPGGDDPDTAREAYMRRCLAWALGQAPPGGRVVAVCGGYHAPAVAGVGPSREDEPFPEPPSPDGAARHGSFLVPFSFRRLDSFAGYESGMPSPAYQDAVWEHGAGRAAGVLLERVATRLRERKQPVSPADLIAASTQAAALARLRAHAEPRRTDLLDGLAAALVKDALEVPLPWSRRGPLPPRTEPLLVEVVAALSGDEEGRLSSGTPRPPIVADIEERLLAHDLVPRETPREVELDLSRDTDRARSRVLHRLRLLSVPGFARSRGPAWATEADLVETWTLERVFETEAALIEAGSYGATLESAALCRLEELVAASHGSLPRLASLLGEAVFAGLPELGGRLLSRVAEEVESASSFEELGAALAPILSLYRHDDLLGSRGSPVLATVLRSGHDRALWLLEGLSGPSAPADLGTIAGVAALRDVVRQAGDRLAIPRDASADVMRRRLADATAPPAVRGAALGFLWSLGHAEGAEAEMRAGVRSCPPSSLGDFLAGLFALAREEAAGLGGLVAILDEVLQALPREEFLIALPALRLAFGYFPPRERERLSRLALERHTGGTAGAVPPRTLRLSPDELARALALDDAVSALAERYGLLGAFA
jgi:hypothetical protein